MWWTGKTVMGIGAEGQKRSKQSAVLIRTQKELHTHTHWQIPDNSYVAQTQKQKVIYQQKHSQAISVYLFTSLCVHLCDIICPLVLTDWVCKIVRMPVFVVVCVVVSVSNVSRMLRITALPNQLCNCIVFSSCELLSHRIPDFSFSLPSLPFLARLMDNNFFYPIAHFTQSCLHSSHPPANSLFCTASSPSIPPLLLYSSPADPCSFPCFLAHPVYPTLFATLMPSRVFSVCVSFPGYSLCWQAVPPELILTKNAIKVTEERRGAAE